jgi:hypothetical protein
MAATPSPSFCPNAPVPEKPHVSSSETLSPPSSIFAKSKEQFPPTFDVRIVSPTLVPSPGETLTSEIPAPPPAGAELPESVQKWISTTPSWLYVAPPDPITPAEFPANVLLTIAVDEPESLKIAPPLPAPLSSKVLVSTVSDDEIPSETAALKMAPPNPALSFWKVLVSIVTVLKLL